MPGSLCCPWARGTSASRTRESPPLAAGSVTGHQARGSPLCGSGGQPTLEGNFLLAFQTQAPSQSCLEKAGVYFRRQGEGLAGSHLGSPVPKGPVIRRGYRASRVSRPLPVPLLQTQFPISVPATTHSHPFSPPLHVRPRTSQQAPQKTV